MKCREIIRPCGEMEEEPVSEIIRRNASGDADFRQPEGPAKALSSPGASSALAAPAI